MAMSSWLVRYPDSLIEMRSARSLRLAGLGVEHGAALGGAAQKLPLVGDAYLIMLRGQVAGKRIKRRGEFQDSHRGFVNFHMPAAAADDGLQQLAVGADGHLDDGRAGKSVAPCDVGEIHGADAFD